MEQELTAAAIDDEAMTLALIEEIAKGAGVNVVSFTSPDDAFAFAGENDIDMVFFDYRMTNTDGLNCLREMRRLLGGVPVVAVTVFDDYTVMDEAARAGATEFVSKPINAVELAARISTIAQLCRARKSLLDRREQEAIRVDDLTAALRLREAEELHFLGRATGFRPDSGSFRTADFAMLIARGAGSDEDEQRRIYHAALVHDAGRAADVRRILISGCSPSAEEAGAIVEYARTGALLSEEGKGEFLREGGIAALALYEWYDGSGAPRGLKGDGIPYSARIIAIADAFDAELSLERTPPVSGFDRALASIRERSGTQFDPSLVAVFLRNEDEARGIYLGSTPARGQFFY